MKKIFSCLIIILCFILMSTSAFAFQKEASIYAPDSDRIAKVVENNDGALKRTLEGFEISIDYDTLMPIYTADIVDYYENNSFNFVPWELDGGQLYMADALDANGNYAGTLVLAVEGTAPDVLMYAPGTSAVQSVDFNANLDRVKSLMSAEKVKIKFADLKLAFIEGIGFVYYIDNGKEAVLVAAGFKGVSGDIFDAESGGIVKVDEALKSKGGNVLAEREANQKAIAELDPDEDIPTGTGISAFIVDNSQYITEDSSYLIWIGAAILLGCIVVGFCLRKKKADAV